MGKGSACMQQINISQVEVWYKNWLLMYVELKEKLVGEGLKVILGDYFKWCSYFGWVSDFQFHSNFVMAVLMISLRCHSYIIETTTPP